MPDIRVGAYGALMESLSNAVNEHANIRQQVVQHADTHAQRRDQKRRHLEILHAAQQVANGGDK